MFGNHSKLIRKDIHYTLYIIHYTLYIIHFCKKRNYTLLRIIQFYPNTRITALLQKITLSNLIVRNLLGIVIALSQTI